MTKILVLANNSQNAEQLCSGAYSLGAEEVALLSWNGPVCTTASDILFTIDVPKGEAQEDAAASVIDVVRDYAPSCILAEATRTTKIVAGMVAASQGTAVITDVLEFTGEGERTMFYGGVAYRTQKAVGPLAIYTVGQGVFEAAQGSRTADIRNVEFIQPSNPIKILSTEPLVREGVDLSSSEIVVAAGRGFAEESDLALARDLANRIGAGLGCSRPLTEAVNWMPKDTYIGVSGKMLKPRVYIGVGISGQMQHMVGVASAGTIVAINKDKNAPIFKNADLGIVGDLKTVLPALLDRL